MTKSLFSTTAYRKLVKNVAREFSDLEAFLSHRTAQGYWRVGRWIDHYLLEHKDRADYGERLIEELARDVDRDISLMNRILKFYRAYPILAARPELKWSHYKSLITISDKAERKKLEQEIIHKGLTVGEIQKYVAAKHRLEASLDHSRAVPRLQLTRGRLNVFQIVKPNASLAVKSSLALDLGFREQQPLPAGVNVMEGDMVQLHTKAGRPIGVSRTDISKDEIFTYQAWVDQVVDGDTLVVSFDFDLDRPVSRKLRLRGINCPERDTPDGQKAKRFVQARLKSCEFIIVKTYKDRTDLWDRYVADVFFLEDCSDCVKVAGEGIYLNQELLDNNLAVVWK